MGSFSWKLARKWTQGVLLEICMFSYTSNAAGESQEVLYWLMQKYVKWWNATGNWNYFPTTFTLLNAAAVPATSYWGQEAWLLCQPPRVPPCQGCARDAALGRAVVASGLHHQPLVPGKYLLNGSASAYGSGRQRCFFQTPVGVFAVSKARWFFPRWLRGEAFKTLCVLMLIYKIQRSQYIMFRAICICKIKISLNIHI